ncbi:MAG: phage virion morphogenesis protein [Dehalococcoidia bacterium]
MTIVFAPTQSPSEVAAKFRAMQARAHALGPVLAPAREMVAKMIDDSFERSQSPDGTAWAKNAPSTIARKRGSAKPGIDKGILRASQYVTVIPNGLDFGTRVPYAAPVQFGSVRGGRLKHASYTGGVKREKGTAWSSTTPGRAFLPFTREGLLMRTGRAQTVIDAVTKMVMAYIVTGKVTP